MISNSDDLCTCMAPNLIKQRVAILNNGERFPILYNKETGPVFWPNMYLMAARRPRSVASNTLRRDGRSIMHLYAWACTEGIDLEDRFEAGRFLTLNETENLTRACHLRYSTLTASLEKDGTQTRRSVIAQMPGTSQVDSGTAYMNISVIAAYLDWLAIRMIQGLPESRVRESKSLKDAREMMRQQIESRRPMMHGRNTIRAREAVSKEELDIILDVVSPVGWRTGQLSPRVKDWKWSERNPWQRHPVRVRNFLIVQTLLNLGIRVGELIGITVDDLKFDKDNFKIVIRRDPDNPNDPRPREPNAKTLDRELAVNAVLGQLLDLYICGVRAKCVNSGKDYGFLFVASDGMPLSDASVRQLWHTLRSRVPELSRDLSSHVMRHTWNYLFSESRDRGRTSPPTLIEQSLEIVERSYQAGWSPTSGTAARYNTRWTQKKGAEASLKLQNEIMHTGGKDEPAPNTQNFEGGSGI